ncbi:hypothetical protein Leryth_004905 [Lithospermum erythrorhizon]|nr:hypothetical protein Leryth_004905 [Lithospermum erythrorhizon]
MVRSSMLPTGKAQQDDLRRLFSKPCPRILIFFVGHHVVEYLLSPKSLEIAFLLPKAIYCCSQSQLNSLLKQAAKMENPFFVSSLIEAGGDVNSRDSEGQSAMSVAVEFGNVNVVQMLIESGFVMNKKDRFFHDAAAIECVEMLEILFLGYICWSFSGFTILATEAGHSQVSLYLISNGGSKANVKSLQGTGTASEIMLHPLKTLLIREKY